MSSATNQQDAKITVYWLEKSRAQRIIWLLEELKVDYELKVFRRGKDFLAPPELKEVHTLGKSPVVGIQAAGAEKPVILAESGTIVEYLTEHFGSWMIPKRYPDGKEGVIGAETEEWLRYRYLMHYVEGSLMTILLLALVTQNIRNAPVPFFLKPITRGIANKIDGSFVNPELKNHMTFLEEYLATCPNNGEFWCGSTLTGADFMMTFALEGANVRAEMETKYPKLYNYFRMIQARDAYKRAGEKVSEASGDKYIPFSDLKL
ncbi:glutathione transferase [Lindgomyces ingoldianus]|uniref:Glutathione transferase n=1 Tax=Lindgomyces ingoldianus TaxID=673940 RepID=A0ACB6QS93_9PLEO|nr:glutathione transferase [Lindgomyces ingoldianus]KAF2469859.1 glutathione transferase [Lindgomyces ingoldianus]